MALVPSPDGGWYDDGSPEPTIQPANINQSIWKQLGQSDFDLGRNQYFSGATDQQLKDALTAAAADYYTDPVQRTIQGWGNLNYVEQLLKAAPFLQKAGVAIDPAALDTLKTDAANAHQATLQEGAKYAAQHQDSDIMGGMLPMLALGLIGGGALGLFGGGGALGAEAAGLGGLDAGLSGAMYGGAGSAIGTGVSGAMLPGMIAPGVASGVATGAGSLLGSGLAGFGGALGGSVASDFLSNWTPQDLADSMVQGTGNAISQATTGALNGGFPGLIEPGVANGISGGTEALMGSSAAGAMSVPWYEKLWDQATNPSGNMASKLANALTSATTSRGAQSTGMPNLSFGSSTAETPSQYQPQQAQAQQPQQLSTPSMMKWDTNYGTNYKPLQTSEPYQPMSDVFSQSESTWNPNFKLANALRTRNG